MLIIFLSQSNYCISFPRILTSARFSSVIYLLFSLLLSLVLLYCALFLVSSLQTSASVSVTDFLHVCSFHCLSIYLCLFNKVFIFLSPQVFLSFCRYVCLSVCLPACLSVCLSVCLSICLSECLSVSLSVRYSICLSITLLIFFPKSYLTPAHPYATDAVMNAALFPPQFPLKLPFHYL